MGLLPKPRHIAIIMDGNRRWAKKTGVSKIKGHEAGSEALMRITRHCGKVGIRYLTVYAISTENFTERPASEIRGLLGLLRKFLTEKRQELKENKVAVRVLGEVSVLPRRLQKLVTETINWLQEGEPKLTVNIALNYGGRAELLRGIKAVVKDKLRVGQITEEAIDERLYSKGEPDPELVIRPGGHKRLSNFLPWQSTYSELYFVDTLWPDFGPKDLDKAIAEYRGEQRNFGK